MLGPADFLIFTLNRNFLTSAVDIDSGRFSEGRVDLTDSQAFVRAIIVHIECFVHGKKQNPYCVVAQAHFLLLPSLKLSDGIRWI